MPRHATGRAGRHTCYNADGELCITVVDPVTRKLLIPTRDIFETRAQLRDTLPSLCQLFLSGRCRQGASCYQVHADWDAVQRMRLQISSLPRCCPAHGDADHLGVIENTLFRDSIIFSSAPLHHPNHRSKNGSGSLGDMDVAAAAVPTVRLKDMVLHLPGCTAFEGGCIPLERVSYTIGLHRLLEDQRSVLAPLDGRIDAPDITTGFPEKKIMIDASAATVCRLHALDRCRYAEECKFLHLCKHVTAVDTQLTADTRNKDPNVTADRTASPFVTGATHATAVDGDRAKNACNGPCPFGSTNVSVPEAAKAATGAAPIRHSVFTTISLQQQQGKSPIRVTSAGPPSAPFGVPLFSAAPATSRQPWGNTPQQDQEPWSSVRNASHDSTNGSARTSVKVPALTSQPLLVPLSERVSRSVGATDRISSQDIPPNSLHDYRDEMRGGAMAPLQSTQQESGGVASCVLGGSMGSYPGNVAISASSATPHSYPAGNGSRIRVSISLPAMSASAVGLLGAGSGTPNSSEKMNSRSLDATSVRGGTSRNNSFMKSLDQGQASSTSTYWQHNPYHTSSLRKADAPLENCENSSGGSLTHLLVSVQVPSVTHSI